MFVVSLKPSKTTCLVFGGSQGPQVVAQPKSTMNNFTFNDKRYKQIHRTAIWLSLVLICFAPNMRQMHHYMPPSNFLCWTGSVGVRRQLQAEHETLHVVVGTGTEAAL